MATKITASAEKNKLFEISLHEVGETSPFKNFIKRGVEKIILSQMASARENEWMRTLREIVLKIRRNSDIRLRLRGLRDLEISRDIHVAD